MVASGAVFLTVMLIFCSSSLRDASSVLSCTAEDGFFNIFKYRAKRNYKSIVIEISYVVSNVPTGKSQETLYAAIYLQLH